MCRITPALMRNYLAWLAIVFRVIVSLSGDWFEWLDRVTADAYWVIRQDDAGYLTFKRLRDEADDIHTLWRDHELTDPDARRLCQGLALRLREWDDQTSFDVSLFSSDVWQPDGECPPFRSFNGRRGMFESQEDVDDPYWSVSSPFCNYLVFTF